MKAASEEGKLLFYCGEAPGWLELPHVCRAFYGLVGWMGLGCLWSLGFVFPDDVEVEAS